MTEPTPVKPILVKNAFKSTSIHGNFQNLDYPDASVLADGYFQRNLKVDGNLNLNSLTLNETDVSGNVIINTSGLAMKSYVNSQISNIDLSSYLTSSALTNKQDTLISSSIIPNLSIQQAFIGNHGLNNNILKLEVYMASIDVGAL
jgi:hypothetical protein